MFREIQSRVEQSYYSNKGHFRQEIVKDKVKVYEKKSRGNISATAGASLFQVRSRETLVRLGILARGVTLEFYK